MNLQFASVRSRPMVPVKSDPSSRWTARRDADILQTEGNYSKIMGLAKRWSLGPKVVLARWHALRLTAPRVSGGPDRQPVSFTSLLAGATPAVRLTLRFLEGVKRSYRDVAAEFNCSQASAKSRVKVARSYCESQGWQIEGFNVGPVYRLVLERRK